MIPVQFQMLYITRITKTDITKGTHFRMSDIDCRFNCLCDIRFMFNTFNIFAAT